MSRRIDEWTAPWMPISVEIDGVAHRGHYQTERGMIRVEYKWESKATQLGGSPAASLARMIMHVIVREVPKDG